MIDITDWKQFFKYKDGELESTNVLYTPYVNPEENILCMSWDETDKYQKDNTRLTKELVDFFFQREITYLTKYQKYPWCPKIIEIDTENRRIYIEWNKETFNTIIHTNRKLEDYASNWKEDIFTILSDIINEGDYKMALYPHCFFVSKDNIVKVFDFYSCLSIDERYLERSLIEGLIGPDSGGRFDEATVETKVDFKLFFKNTLNNQLQKTWPDNPFPEFYNRLFTDV
jgi:hypothetical protein